MENIVPSIKITPQIPLKELSPQEFQQTLSAWMEEKGLVQDLRSYLKYQMINMLKSTAIGKNIQKNCTLAQQALHLIVAEYLQHYQCNFALSLFSTEVNLTNVLPLTKLYAQETLVNKFDKDNLVNILELLGIRKDCFARILHEYFEQGKALLVCLLNINTNEANDDEILPDIDIEDDFIKHIHLTLQSTTLPQKTQMQLLNNLKASYDLKTKTYQNQVIQLIEKFQKEFHYRDQKLHYNQKRKKILEKQIDKLKQENCKLKQNNSECVLMHCNSNCDNLKMLNDSYKNEIDKLKSTNMKQKQEIERLNRHCEQLLLEFNACQSKISLASAKLDQPDSDKELSLSSDSGTEQILQQAKQKLKLLEEESEELDIKFHRFVIK